MIYKHPNNAKEGYYMVYYNLSNSKSIYIIVIKEGSLYMISKLRRSFHHKYGVIPMAITKLEFLNIEISRMFFDKSDKGILFKLTDEEFFMETAGAL